MTTTCEEGPGEDQRNYPTTGLVRRDVCSSAAGSTQEKISEDVGCVETEVQGKKTRKPRGKRRSSPCKVQLGDRRRSRSMRRLGRKSTSVAKKPPSARGGPTVRNQAALRESTSTKEPLESPRGRRGPTQTRQTSLNDD